MALKQISLSMPEKLLNASKQYTKEMGYKNVQEFILDLVRRKVILENIDRYKAIENKMKQGKDVKKLSQKDAVEYLKSF